MNGMTAEQTIEYLKAYVECATKRPENDLELEALEDISDAYARTTYKAYFNDRNPASASLLCSESTKEECIRNIKAAETLDELHEHLFSPKALANTQQRLRYNPNQLHDIVGHVMEVVKKCIDKKLHVSETVVSTRELQPFDVARTSPEVVPETQDIDRAEPVDVAPESVKKARKSGSKSALEKYKERLSRQETVEDLTKFMKKTLTAIVKNSDIQPSLGLVEDYVLHYVRQREHIRHWNSKPDTLSDMLEKQWINVRDSVQMLGIDATYEEIDGAWDYDPQIQNGTSCLSQADILNLTDFLKSKFRNLIGQMRVASNAKTVQYVQKNSKTVHVTDETEQDEEDDQDEGPEIESSKKGGGKLPDPFDMGDCPWIAENKLTHKEIKEVEKYYLEKLEKAETLDNVQKVWNNFYYRANHAKTQLTGKRFAKVFSGIISAARKISNENNPTSSELPVRNAGSYLFRLNNAVYNGQNIQDLLTILFCVDKYVAHTMDKLEQNTFAKIMETGIHLLRAAYMKDSLTSDAVELFRSHLNGHSDLNSFWMAYFKYKVSCYSSLDHLKEYIEFFQSLMLSPEISIPNQVSGYALFLYLKIGMQMRKTTPLNFGEIDRAKVIEDSQTDKMVENLTSLGEDFSISQMHETLFSHNLKEILDQREAKKWRAIKIETAYSVSEIIEKILNMFNAKKIKAIPVGGGGAALSSTKIVEMSGKSKIGATPIGEGAVDSGEESDPLASAQDLEFIAKVNRERLKRDELHKKAARAESVKKRKTSEITDGSESSKKRKESSDTAKKTDLSTLESAKYGDYPRKGDERFPPEFWKNFGAGVMMMRGLGKGDK